MAETILVVGSASIDQQSVIWQLLKADYQVRYAASNSIAIGIISAEMPSAVLLSQQSDKAQEMCFFDSQGRSANLRASIREGS
jgi:hypothetical protein